MLEGCALAYSTASTPLHSDTPLTTTLDKLFCSWPVIKDLRASDSSSLKRLVPTLLLPFTVFDNMHGYAATHHHLQPLEAH